VIFLVCLFWVVTMLTNQMNADTASRAAHGSNSDSMQNFYALGPGGIGLVALGALIEWLRSQFPGRRRDFEGSMIFLPIIVVIVGGFALMILYAIASTVAK